jgi:hypothetical protein
MSEQKTKRERFNWWLPMSAALGALVLFLPFMVYAPDLGIIFCIIVLVPFISLILLTIAIVNTIRRKKLLSLANLSTLIVFCIVSFLLFTNSRNLRTSVRWLLWSKNYKAQVQAQPYSPKGDLKHVEWDAWGWGGQDMTVYLVFDPSDSPSKATAGRLPVKSTRIPCPVANIHRLERNWYTVLFPFYVDESWDNCR